MGGFGWAPPAWSAPGAAGAPGKFFVLEGGRGDFKGFFFIIIYLTFDPFIKCINRYSCIAWTNDNWKTDNYVDKTIISLKIRMAMFVLAFFSVILSFTFFLRKHV